MRTQTIIMPSYSVYLEFLHLRKCLSNSCKPPLAQMGILISNKFNVVNLGLQCNYDQNTAFSNVPQTQQQWFNTLKIILSSPCTVSVAMGEKSGRQRQVRREC